MTYIKKILTFIFGQKNSPLQVSVALYLGTLVGLTPTFATLHSILAILSIVFLRISWRLFAFSLALSFSIGLSFGDSINHLIGSKLLEAEFLESLWAFIDMLPIIPWMKLSISGVLGAFVISVCSFPIYYFLFNKIQDKNNVSDDVSTDDALFRKKTWIPAAILFAGLIYYKMFLLDSHIKKGMIAGLEMINGAQVDIASVKTTIFPVQLLISNIALTDPKSPKWNRLTLSTIDFKFDRSALWRGKFILDYGIIENILTHTARATPGWVAPKEVEKVEASSEKKDIWKPIVDMIENFDPVKDIKNFDKNDLATLKIINGLKEDLAKQQVKWKDINNVIPLDWSAEEKFIKNLDLKINNPLEIPKKIEEVKAIVDGTQEKIKKAKTEIETLKQDIKNYQNSFKEIESSINADRAFIESKLKLPELKLEDLAMGLFGDEVKSKIRLGKKYYYLLYPYITKYTKDSGKKSMEVQEVKKVRYIGERYQFNNEEKWPLFWVRKIAINSPRKDKDDSKFEGSIHNISSDSKVIGQVMSMKINGEIPAYDIHRFKFGLTLDTIQEPSTLSLMSTLNKNIPLPIPFAKSKHLNVSLLSGEMLIVTDAKITKSHLDATLNISFIENKFKVESNQKIVQNILQDTLNATKIMKVSAKIAGELNNPSITLESNISQQLQDGINGAIKGQLDKAKASIDEFVQSNILDQKKQLLAQFDKIKNELQGSLDVKEKVANGASEFNSQALKKAIETIKNGAVKEAAKEQLKDLKNLKDKIKFKF